MGRVVQYESLLDAYHVQYLLDFENEFFLNDEITNVSFSITINTMVFGFQKLNPFFKITFLYIRYHDVPLYSKYHQFGGEQFHPHLDKDFCKYFVVY